VYVGRRCDANDRDTVVSLISSRSGEKQLHLTSDKLLD